MPFYRAFGLRIDSNVPLPGLILAASSDPADIAVVAGVIPDDHRLGSVELDGDTVVDRHVYRLDNGSIYIDFKDGTKFWVAAGGDRIWTTWLPPYTVADMATYLLGPILGYVLRLRGTVTLHASTFVTNQRAVALLGSAGAGKSTTVAAMAERGFAVLADDVTVLKDSENGFLVEPSYPRLRLWPESVEMLYGSRESLEPITPNWDKRDYRLDAPGRFPTQAVPLGAIFCLTDRSTADDAPRIESLTGQEKFVSLVANTYGNRLLDSAMRRDEFEVLSRLVQSVPIKRLVPHSSPDRLSQMCDLLSQALSRSPLL